MLWNSNLSNNRLNLSSQANILSIVLNLSLKIFRQKVCFLPRLDFLRLLLFSGILGVMPRLKIALRFLRELYTPSKLMVLSLRSIPISFTIFFKFDIAGVSRIPSFLLPGAVTKGAITLQFLSQNGTTLSPLVCL
ncbi:hypothetical protein N3Z16_03900 [Candidatus Megaera polyxenophila]|jgi:hypothetical protein|uniref:hypothetical protein n=1 Tax=Candidatus Megaera polyxenophila TaxID=988779 RepID=UPI00249DD716|nr:hypothetical protein N3Z16_06220 [Candidatus Megaera polyxenophila]WHA06053.1 hypothetical protein N3Z16_06290 [Candidatus Megaera polyxenophila]WHA06061.1 hypothetical protein N3Z16_06330 [Candidatus Megaera polyxenophila]WHA06064.1 hypothetical protein N3Z16_06345 [Candidatus Megaera polyxenophila]WHA06072.1 hypothetical protein N3Z16_06390 [Candidatus Megaera polyxenophila]